MDRWNRQSIRIKKFDYSHPGYFFITICTYNRKCVFGEIEQGEIRLNDYGQIVKALWLKLEENPRIHLDSFVIMPNHFHGILDVVGVSCPSEKSIHKNSIIQYAINRRRMQVPMAIGKFKMQSAKAINKLLGRTGSPLWQRNYFEEVIRDPISLLKVRNYIKNNPQNWFKDEFFSDEFALP